jgi:hypothetical protein
VPAMLFVHCSHNFNLQPFQPETCKPSSRRSIHRSAKLRRIQVANLDNTRLAGRANKNTWQPSAHDTSCILPAIVSNSRLVTAVEVRQVSSPGSRQIQARPSSAVWPGVAGVDRGKSLPLTHNCHYDMPSSSLRKPTPKFASTISTPFRDHTKCRIVRYITLFMRP